MRSHREFLRRRAELLLTLISCVAAPAAAHDLWLEPSTFSPRAGEALAVSVQVGEQFRGRAVVPDPRRIERFAAISKRGASAIGRDGDRDPIGVVALGSEGPAWLVYESRPHEVELPAERFEAYLEEEALERIRELRRARGTSGAPGRERFSRCAKALIGVGGGPGEPTDRALGLDLEIVLEPAAGSDRPGGPSTARLLLRGEPLAGARISAFARGGARPALEARTDAQGRVRLALEAGEVWLLRAVHMEPISPAPRSGPEWASYWASLVFEIRASGRVPSR